MDLINELNSRNWRNTTNIKEVNIGNQVLDSSNQMAEAFNTYFSNVGSNLADEIPSTSDFKTFSVQLPSIENVKRLLKNIDEKKSVGLDKIPNKVLKRAADVVAPCSPKASAIYRSLVFDDRFKLARCGSNYSKVKRQRSRADARVP